MSGIPYELLDYHTQRSDNQHTAKVQAKNGLLLKLDSGTDTNKSAKISSKLSETFPELSSIQLHTCQLQQIVYYKLCQYG